MFLFVYFRRDDLLTDLIKSSLTETENNSL